MLLMFAGSAGRNRKSQGPDFSGSTLAHGERCCWTARWLATPRFSEAAAVFGRPPSIIAVVTEAPERCLNILPDRADQTGENRPSTGHSAGVCNFRANPPAVWFRLALPA